MMATDCSSSRTTRASRRFSRTTSHRRVRRPSGSEHHDALRECQSFPPDLVLLDIKFPDGDGFELCQVLRHGGRRPVIFVSARGQRADKVRGLGLGADDYVTKPFDIEELVARIHAVLRRTRPSSRRSFWRHHRRLRDLTGDARPDSYSSQQPRVRPVAISGRTCRGRRPPRSAVRRDWGVHDGSTTRAVDFAVARLRKKIEPIRIRRDSSGRCTEMVTR